MINFEYPEDLILVMQEIMYCGKRRGCEFRDLRTIAYHGASMAEMKAMDSGKAGDMLTAISRASAEDGDFMKAVNKAIEDKFVSSDEVDLMEKELIEDLVAKVHLLRLARYKATTGEDVHVVG